MKGMKQVKPGCFVIEDSDEKDAKENPLSKPVDKYAKYGLKEMAPGCFVHSEEQPRKDLEILVKVSKIEPERVFKPRNPDLIDSNADYYASFKSNRRR